MTHKAPTGTLVFYNLARYSRNSTLPYLHAELGYRSDARRQGGRKITAGFSVPSVQLLQSKLVAQYRSPWMEWTTWNGQRGT
ncbi:MAG: hypothetical protein R3E01_30955 [Pirellulaceae bacterium]